MKFKARTGALVVVTALAAFLAGCASQPTYSGQRTRSARDFEIVETSSRRTLTTREMVHLKQKVEAYLAQEGQTGTGDYYVKIYLGEEQGVASGEWVVVRYTKEPAVRYSVLAMTPSYYDPYYSSYAYNAYPFPGYGYTRLSFQYYDYPYYGYRPYPVSRRSQPGRGHHGDRDGKPGEQPDRDRPTNDGRPSGALKPSYKPTFVPANVNPPPVNTTDPTIDEPNRKERPPTIVDVRSRPRQRTINPDAPRPGPVGAPDFSVRRTIPATGAGTLRPNLNQRPVQVRPDPAVTQRVAPRQSTPAGREVRSTPPPRPSSATTFKPSAPQARPAPAPVQPAPVARPAPTPAYKAPVERTESRAEANSTSSGERVNRYDGANRGLRH